MDKHIATFPWESSRSSNQQCQVYLRDTKVGQMVTIEQWKGDKGTRIATFRPQELPQIIEALQKAQAEL